MFVCLFVYVGVSRVDFVYSNTSKGREYLRRRLRREGRRKKNFKERLIDRQEDGQK